MWLKTFLYICMFGVNAVNVVPLWKPKWLFTLSYTNTPYPVELFPIRWLN